MTSPVLKLFANASAKKSVDSVLSAFKVAIADLDGVKAQATQEAHEQEQQAIVAQANARAAREEAKRAEEVSGKLRNLIAA